MKLIPEKWRGTIMPKTIPAWFWLWAHWRDLQKQGIMRPRPASIPSFIPPWAWVRYLIHRGYKWADIGTPTSGLLDHATSVIFHAGEVLEGLAAVSYYIRALSADRAQNWLAPFVQAVHDHGCLVASWCDCRPGDGTDASYAINAARTHGLIGWYGQAETAAQFDHALQRGRELGLMPLALVGNLGELRPDQLALVAAGDVKFINETYYNLMPWIKPDWRGANAGVEGNCVACYGSTSEKATYFPLAQQIAEGKFVKGRDSIYGPGCRLADWQAA